MLVLLGILVAYGGVGRKRGENRTWALGFLENNDTPTILWSNFAELL
jgi:hypothetical protein